LNPVNIPPLKAHFKNSILPLNVHNTFISFCTISQLLAHFPKNFNSYKTLSTCSSIKNYSYFLHFLISNLPKFCTFYSIYCKDRLKNSIFLSLSVCTKRSILSGQGNSTGSDHESSTLTTRPGNFPNSNKSFDGFILLIDLQIMYLILQRLE